jgi:hypothetical protein
LDSDENISKAETNVEEVNILDFSEAHMDNCYLKDTEEHFEEFLRNSRGEESSPKYETLALELVKTREITIDASMADIRNHNQNLMGLINAIEYKEAFQFLSSTLLKFAKARDPDMSSNKLLVKLVP